MATADDKQSVDNTYECATDVREKMLVTVVGDKAKFQVWHAEHLNIMISRHQI